MYGQVSAHNFFWTTLSAQVNDTDLTGTILMADKTVNGITVEDGNYLFRVILGMNNPTELEIFRITNVTGNTLTFDRRISPNGLHYHIVGDIIQINDAGEFTNRANDNLDTFGYTEDIPGAANALKAKVYGGRVSRNGNSTTTAVDTTITLNDNVTTYIYYDVVTNTFLTVETTEPSTNDKYVVAKVVTATGDITSIEDYRSFSTQAYGFVTGPATNTDNYVPQWNGTNTNTLKNGLGVVTIVGNPGSDTNLPTEKAVRDAVNSGGGGGGTGTIFVDVIFDDHNNDLPADTATQIDGYTVIHGTRCYVKDCSDASKIGKIYTATVVGTAITWTYTSTVAPGSWVYSTNGTVYGNTVIIAGDSNVNIGGNTTLNNLTVNGGGVGNNYLVLTGTMAGIPPEADITDTRITDTTPYLVFYETQPVGNITRTLTNGNLNIVSDDNADTLDVKVLFRNIGPARNYMKGNLALTGAGPRVISDPRFTATTPAMIMPRTVPVGYITATTGAGVMTISSTGTEVGVVVDYIVTLDTTNYSDGMPYNATLDDDDMFFRKSAVSGEDEAFKVSDLHTQSSSQAAYDTTGTSSAYDVTIPNVPSYTDNTIFMVRFHTTNVANATLNVNTLGDIPMLDLNGNTLIADILNINNTYLIRYESTNGKMYVAEMLNVGAMNNYQGNYLDLLPIETGRVDFSLTGMSSPAGTIYDGTRYIYISDEANNKVYKFDTRTNTIGPNVNVGAKARGIIIDGGYIYVSCNDGNRIDKIDIATFTNVGNVGTSASPQDMCVVGGFLYTACNGANKVDKIDLSTFTNVGNVGTGTMLLYFGEGLASDGTYLYVGCRVSNRVDKIDLSTFTNIGNVAVGTAPNNILYYNGFIYVSCETGDRVDKIDTTTFLNVANIGGLDDPRPQGALIYNNYLYISCRGTDTIEKINLTTFLKEGVGVAVATDPGEIELVGTYLYALNQGSVSLSRLGLNTLSAPPTGYFRLFFKTTGKLYRMDDTGAEQLIGTQS